MNGDESDSAPARRAVVTGGAGALAGAIGEALGGAAYRVALPTRAELDVTCAESVKAYFAAVGEVDLLINAAGVTRDAALLRLDEADWDTVLGVNLDGAFRCARAVLRGMLKRRSGHIINIASFSAKRPPPGQAAYAAAKAGLFGMTQALAAEAGSRGVRVNAVLPGFLETPMTAKLDAKVVERALSDHLLGRFNTTAEAAKFIVALDGMSAVSGQVFQLDSRLSRQL